MADVTGRPSRWRPFIFTVYPPTIVLAALSGWLAWRGWTALSSYGPFAAIRAGQLNYCGPVVLTFVALLIGAERVWPAQRRPVLARGHVLDFGYLLAYALLVMPFVTLISAGTADELEKHASWLVLPHLSVIPPWVVIAISLVVIDATDWLVHFLNHRFNPLWRFHAVHHSQEELSVLTTFRAHPLVHLSFAITAVPGFALAANAATPTRLLTLYACLGALPHTNVDWTYGRLRRLVISPAYHRLHHRDRGRLDVNLGVVFPYWDMLTRRALFPAAERPLVSTGLHGRPIPIEQAGVRPRFAGTFVTQWLEPFARMRRSVNA
jgi:sterol desaturase/sphingolipid hydroxylase (fatty acid hydroxylase superfamily)